MSMSAKCRKVGKDCLNPHGSMNSVNVLGFAGTAKGTLDKGAGGPDLCLPWGVRRIKFFEKETLPPILEPSFSYIPYML